MPRYHRWLGGEVGWGAAPKIRETDFVTGKDTPGGGVGGGARQAQKSDAPAVKRGGETTGASQAPGQDVRDHLFHIDRKAPWPAPDGPLTGWERRGDWAPARSGPHTYEPNSRIMINAGGERWA